MKNMTVHPMRSKVLSFLLFAMVSLEIWGAGFQLSDSSVAAAASGSQVVLAVNCGGGQYTDKLGVVYKADMNFSGGQTYQTTAPIAGTDDSPLYQSERWGNFSYNLPVTNGTYNVTLKFAELYCSASNCRVFSVKVEGMELIRNLDLFAKVGKNRAYDFTTPITVTDGVLNIEFSNAAKNAKVNAILVTAGQPISQYTITASAGDGGTISPGGGVSIPSGDSQTFTIAAKAGYKILDVNVDGESKGATNTLTIANVTANHVVEATFTRVGPGPQVVWAVNCGGAQYTDKSGVVYKGDMNFSGGQTYQTTAPIAGTDDGPLYQSERWGNFSYNIPVTNGTYNVTLKFAELYCSASNCRVFSVKLEGMELIRNLDLFAKAGKNRAYDFTTPITVADGVLNIEFYNAKKNAKVNAILVASEKPVSQYTITASAGAGGTISPSGVVNVPSGGTQTFTIAAKAGYKILDVKVDGESKGATNTLTFANVTANHAVEATFSQVINPVITASAGAEGTISPSGAVSVPSGGSQTFTIRANAGYRIADVQVDNVSKGAISSFTFSNVTANHTIGATFSQEEPIDFYGNQVHFLKMFGQHAYGETTEDTVVANRVFHASGVVVDRSSRPNKIYVVDTGNNRILGFNGLGVCQNDPNLKCTNNTDCSGGPCQINPDKNADVIIGQPDAISGTCNGDNNLGIDTNPTASTLCVIGYPRATNIGEYWMRANFDVDSQGNLYVVDTWNNRVLKYNQPFSPDKSNGKGDTAADFVWGQDDLNRNGVNRGQGRDIRDSRSIYTSFGGFDHVASRGVSVDAQGNVWVADTFNFRVLRFSPNSNEANLVLGQSSFTSAVTGNCGYGRLEDAPLNRMCTPTLARLHPETGELYVIDEYPNGFRARILVFAPPFTNGKAAHRVLMPNQDVPIVDNRPYVFRSTGLIFNTFKAGEYVSGEVWVVDNGRVLLLDRQGNILKVVGAPNKSYLGCEYHLYTTCGQGEFKNFPLCAPGGSIGLDNLNNIYIADEHFMRISRFALPYITGMVGDKICLPDANGGLFNTSSPNSISGSKWMGSVGNFTFGNQLAIKDASRYLVWNNYLDKELGAKADFVVGQPRDDTREAWSNLGSRGIHTVDDKGRLWIFSASGDKIIVYQLPFVQGSQPLANNVGLYWIDDGTKVDFGGHEVGMAFDRINKKLWITDRKNSRLLRVSNYDDFQNKLYVDMVLGQGDKTGVACNRGRGNNSPSADSFCTIFQIKFDQLGNLYVVENVYECHPNDRITVFMAEDLQNARGLFPNLAARKVFVSDRFDQPATCNGNRLTEPFSPVSIAFNSQNNMVVGNDGYYGSVDRHWKQLWFYLDPLKKNPDGSFVQGQKPDAYIKIPMGAAAEINFDDQDNLIIQDHTWCRAWVINLDRDPSWLVPVNQ